VAEFSADMMADPARAAPIENEYLNLLEVAINKMLFEISSMVEKSGEINPEWFRSYISSVDSSIRDDLEEKILSLVDKSLHRGMLFAEKQAKRATVAHLRDYRRYEPKTIPLSTGLPGGLGISMGFTYTIPEPARQAVRSRNLQQVEGLSSQTKADIMREITDGMTAGAGPREIARRISGLTDVSRSRAERIARTEVMSGINTAVRDRYRSMGIERFEWMSATEDDGRICDRCKELDGKIIPEETNEFPPLHPNCRCTIRPARKAEEEKEESPGISDELSLIVRGEGDSLPFTMRQEEMLPLKMKNLSGGSSFDVYRGSGYYSINTYLRNPEKYPQLVEIGDRMIAEDQVKELVASMDKSLSKAEELPPGLELFRGLGDQSGREMWERSEIGDIIKDKAYQSSSLSPRAAGYFALVWDQDMENRVQHRTMIRKITLGGEKGIYYGFGGEYEVTLPRGSEWKVVQKDTVERDVGNPHNPITEKIHIITVIRRGS
jgi:SPP1 gp7 family putative phage head morphogenesis protein